MRLLDLAGHEYCLWMLAHVYMLKIKFSDYTVFSMERRPLQKLDPQLLLIIDNENRISMETSLPLFHYLFVMFISLIFFLLSLLLPTPLSSPPKPLAAALCEAIILHDHQCKIAYSA